MGTKRFAIYVIYDKDGLLDPYREFFIESLRPYVTTICATICGTLQKNEILKLEKLVDEVYIRDNEGLLATAWKDSIHKIGQKTLDNYDELYLLNDSFFGPIYPISDFIDKSEKINADFYGIMRNYKDDSINYIGDRYLNTTYQGTICYFYIIKKKLLSSKKFYEYWKKIPKINTDWDSIYYAEIYFYEYLQKNNFIIESYQSNELNGYFFDCLTHCSFKLIHDEKIPFVRIRSLGTDLKQIRNYSNGDDPRKSITYISEKTTYDEKLIWNYLTRTKQLVDIYYQTNLDFIINELGKKPITGPHLIVFFLTNPEYISSFLPVLFSFSNCIKVKIYTDDPNIQLQLSTINATNVEILCLPTLNLSSIIEDCANDISTHKYFGFFSDKYIKNSDYRISKDTLITQCISNLVQNESIIGEIESIFTNNSHIGALFSETPLYGGHYINSLNLWQLNKESISAYFKDKNLTLDLCKPPIIVPANMFWIRSSLILQIIKDVKYFES